MATHAVLYTYDPQRLPEMLEIRPRHREFLATLITSGQLLAAGAWADSESDPGALLLLDVESPAAALAALEADPFLSEGIITNRRAYRWSPALGRPELTEKLA